MSIISLLLLKVKSEIPCAKEESLQFQVLGMLPPPAMPTSLLSSHMVSKVVPNPEHLRGLFALCSPHLPMTQLSALFVSIHFHQVTSGIFVCVFSVCSTGIQSPQGSDWVYFGHPAAGLSRRVSGTYFGFNWYLLSEWEEWLVTNTVSTAWPPWPLRTNTLRLHAIWSLALVFSTTQQHLPHVISCPEIVWSNLGKPWLTLKGISILGQQTISAWESIAFLI